MTELALLMGISVDGFVARHGRYGAGGWGGPAEDPELKARKLEWLGSAGFHLMGRNTYEEMAGFWPTADDAYAAPMNNIPKVVFSRTLQHADWPDSRIAAGETSEVIAQLKRESAGGDLIVWGGAALARSLARQGLVDEYRRVRQPVALGDGLPLFSGLTAPVAFWLTESVSYASGEVLTIYRQTSPPRG
jgi:dihydrofolate reductase